MENKIKINKQKTFLMILKEIFNAIHSRSRVVGLLILGIISLAFVLLLIWINHDRYSVLFDNLSQDNSTAIIEQLMLKNIPCKLTDNNTCIKVRSSYVDEWRLRFASQGLPGDGSTGNNEYGAKWIGDSQYKHKLNYLHMIQADFAKTISWIDAVDKARIHIVDGDFNEKEGGQATASVALKLKKGRGLSHDQLIAIVNLISSGVKDLSPEDVTIVDTTGKLLSVDQTKQPAINMTSADIAYKKNVENDLEKRVRGMLERILGQNKVIVKITAEVNIHDSQLQNNPLISDRKSNKTSGFNSSIKRLFVAIIIDDRHDTSNNLNNKVVLLNEERIIEIKNLIKNAVGFNPERGDQISLAKIPFASQGELFEKPSQMSLILSFIQINQQVILNIIVILFFFFMIIMPAMKWLKSIKTESVKKTPQIESGDDNDLRNKTKIIANQDLDKAVEIIRTMMKGKE